MQIEEIGDRNYFSIVYQIIDTNDEDDYTDEVKHKWWYGHLCFYAHNLTIGRYEEWTSLIVVRNYLKDFLENHKCRFVDEDLYNQSNEMIFDILYEQFYGRVQENFNLDTKKYNIDHYDKVRDNFHLDEVGEDAFRDKFGVILLNSKKQKKQKLIWKNFKTGELFCTQFEEFCVDEILSSFYDNLSKVLRPAQTAMSRHLRQAVPTLAASGGQCNGTPK